MSKQPDFDSGIYKWSTTITLKLPVLCYSCLKVYLTKECLEKSGCHKKHLIDLAEVDIPHRDWRFVYGDAK